MAPNLHAAHITDIFSLAVTPTQILSGSGSSTLKVHSTNEADFPLAQTLEDVHKLGCHHVATSKNGKRAVSAGFGGEVKLWRYAGAGSTPAAGGEWIDDGGIAGADYVPHFKKIPCGGGAREVFWLALLS